jgi:hypothetical protein
MRSILNRSLCIKTDCTTAKICELETRYSGRGNGCLYTGLAPIHRVCILSIAVISPLIREGYIPDLLKSSMIFPIRKVTPPQSVESELRPISLTWNVAKIMEGFFCKRLLSQLTRKIDPATILAKIMWTPNFPNANINIEKFFHEICLPLPPIQCCFSYLNCKSFIYQHWIGGGGGEIFWGLIL